MLRANSPQSRRSAVVTGTNIFDARVHSSEGAIRLARRAARAAIRITRVAYDKYHVARVAGDAVGDGVVGIGQRRGRARVRGARVHGCEGAVGLACRAARGATRVQTSGVVAW